MNQGKRVQFFSFSPSLSLSFHTRVYLFCPFYVSLKRMTRGERKRIEK